MLNKAPISVLIPTKNEAHNLAACLASVEFCDEVIVVDSASNDDTPHIAGKFGAQVINFQWDGKYPKKKNWALSEIKWRHEWVFILDADECITPALAAELRVIVSSPTVTHDGYYVNRRFWFLDGWLKHCGYYPSWNLRFFRHSKGRYEQLGDNQNTNSGDNEVHEHVLLDGTSGYLQGEMDHYAFPDIATWVEKHNRYSNWEALIQHNSHLNQTPAIEAKLLRKRKIRKLAWHLPFRPLLRFLYHYIWRAGFLDGYRGFIFCRLMGWYEFLCATKAKEIRRSKS